MNRALAATASVILPGAGTLFLFFAPSPAAPPALVRAEAPPALPRRTAPRLRPLPPPSAPSARPVAPAVMPPAEARASDPAPTEPAPRPTTTPTLPRVVPYQPLDPRCAARLASTIGDGSP